MKSDSTFHQHRRCLPGHVLVSISHHWICLNQLYCTLNQLYGLCFNASWSIPCNHGLKYMYWYHTSIEINQWIKITITKLKLVREQFWGECVELIYLQLLYSIRKQGKEENLNKFFFCNFPVFCTITVHWWNQNQ